MKRWVAWRGQHVGGQDRTGPADLLELSPDLACVTRRDGHVLMANSQFETMLGWSPRHIVGASLTRVVHPDDIASTEEAFERVFAEPSTVALRNRVRCRDGAWKPLSWHALGDPEHGVVCWTGRDVSDDEEVLRAFAKHTGTVAWIEDSAAVGVAYIGCGFQELWGLPESKLRSDSTAWLDVVHPDDAARARGPSPREYRIVHRDGSIRWISDQSFPLRVVVGGRARLVRVSRDVTDRREAQEQLRQTERLVSLGTLSAGIVHELNNPLAAISLSAAAALQAKPETLDTRQVLDRVLGQAKRCATIVSNVLQFARGDTLDKQPGDVNECVQRAIELLEHYCKRRGVGIEVALGSDLPTLAINRVALQQALVNLLKNACDAGARRVTVRTERDAGVVRLTVEDDGRGLGAESKVRAFDAFYSTRREQGGVGLGLNVTRGIVADHDGVVRITDRSGGGTRVVVELPEPIDKSPHLS